MTNPYEQLPDAAYWRPAVGRRHPLDIAGLWTSKIAVARDDQVLTAGSCFAQHIGSALQQSGFNWLDTEPAPKQLSAADRRRFNYGLFSFRTGNIYTVALFKQWLQWATGAGSPSPEVWVKSGRVYDPFRPTIEPGGFASEAELLASRAVTLAAIRDGLSRCSLLILTLGLTEAWIDRRDGRVYPMCPGVAAGTFDPAIHAFHNFRFAEILADLNAVVDLLHTVNPAMSLLLTVSPVPLTATASSDHVLVATTQSKSTLRAVAGELARTRDEVDYFPAYDIVSGFPFRGMFYEPNLRSVSRHGVDFVMRCFFEGLRRSDAPSAGGDPADESTHAEPDLTADDLVCEDILLQAFERAAP